VVGVKDRLGLGLDLWRVLHFFPSKILREIVLTVSQSQCKAYYLAEHVYLTVAIGYRQKNN
jgi:hypothetical protein